MRRAQTFQQKSCQWIRCAAEMAALFLIATTSAAQSKPVTPATQQSPSSLTQELNKYPGLLPEFGQLFTNLQNNVQFPSPRSESHLLPLLPASAIVYGAFPNYGDAAHQFLQIFRQELQASVVLRDWWHSGDRAASGPKIEDFFEKFYQLHQYLGDEIVVSGVMEGRQPALLVAAEVRKPGLQKFLQQTIDEYGGASKAGVRVMDLEELATAKDKDPTGLKLLVRPDFVVGAEKLEILRSFNTRLDQGNREFASTPFGQRVRQAYHGGVSVLAGADLQKILEQTPNPAKQDASFRRSGFADVKYLVWEHKGVGAQAISQAELSFTGPRHGPAAWLAKPAPLGSLDFVSPDAMAAAALVLTSMPQIFDDIKELAGPSSDPLALIAGGEKALNVSVKDDLLGYLGGELTVELDSIAPPRPAWKALLSVKDAVRLQRTVGNLLALTQLQTADVEDGGITFHSVAVPSSPSPTEIIYAFVDGYLIVASSRDAVAEAVRLHRSGGSLAKSRRFLATRPPGHSPEASGMFYEDPLTLAALQLRQVAPEMAETLAQVSRDSTPAVFYLYGDDRAIREASSGGAFDVGTILVVAAVAIPNLLRSKIAANEATAVGSVRTVNTAQVAYETSYPKKGFAPNLAALGVDPRNLNAYSAEHAGLLDPSLANDSCTGDAWCTKSGFHFKITAVCKQHVCTDYVVVAIPVESNKTGIRGFCSTSDGVIRSKTGPPFSQVGIAECKTWPPLE